MSNSIETPIDIDFLRGIDIGIAIDFGYPWKIDIGIEIDFWDFEQLALVLTLTVLGSMSMGNWNGQKLPVLYILKTKKCKNTYNRCKKQKKKTL